MAKKKEGPLPEPAERVIEQFLSALSDATDRDRYRQVLEPLYRALCDLETAARQFNRQVEKTASEVVRIADSLGDRDDPISTRLKLASLGPMVDALRAQLAGRESERRGRKRTRWTLDSTVLGGLVAFGNKPGYPSAWPTRTGRQPRFLRLFGSSSAAGQDWLTVFLLYRVVEAWRIVTGLWAPKKLADFDVDGDPDRCFHMMMPDSSSWSVAGWGRSGRRSPIELTALVDALQKVAPDVGPTLVARHLMERAKERDIDHPVIDNYRCRRVGGETSLEREIKHLRAAIRKQHKSASSRRHVRRS